MPLPMLVFMVVLFFVLTPGILVRLPPKGSKFAVAAVHAIVFAVAYTFLHKMVWRTLYEGFQGTTTTTISVAPPMKKKERTPPKMEKKPAPSKRVNALRKSAD